MEILNRTNAPFSNGVWSVIDETMGEFLSKRLNLRGVVDFKDQYTYDTDAIFTKELKNISDKKGLSISTREPIKMVEIKKTFTISNDTIDQIKRGVEDFEDKELATAANEFATIENNMILEGLKEASFTGIANHPDVVTMEVKSTKDILSSVAKSLGVFNKEFVDGGFKLVVSSGTLAKLYTEFFDGISVKTKLDDILGAGNTVVNEDIGDNRAMIISQRGGDFEFCSGLDLSIGFEKAAKDSVELFLIQTCALRILSPEAAIILNLK
jgi:uncharacterized linocin/CFP29 family protein